MLLFANISTFNFLNLFLLFLSHFYIFYSGKKQRESLIFLEIIISWLIYVNLQKLYDEFFSEIIQVNILLEKNHETLEQDSSPFWIKIGTDSKFRTEFENNLAYDDRFQNYLDKKDYCNFEIF